MAVMLNIMPPDGKPITVSKNVNMKSPSNGDKSVTDFAKKLDVETEKSSLDVDGEMKSKDDMQLIAAMANMVLPMMANIIPVNQVAADEIGKIGNFIQTQSADIVPSVVENQLTMAVVSGLQDQLVATVPNGVPQTQLTAVVPNGVSQDRLSDTLSNVVPQVQLAAVVPNGASPKVELNTGVDASQSQLEALVAQMTPVTAQGDGNQLGEFVKLQVQNQEQIQKQTILGQLQMEEVAAKDTDVLMNNPVLSKIVTSSSPISNFNDLGKNSKKQIDDRKITDIPFNADATKVVDVPVLIDALDVKPVSATQIPVAVSDALTSGNKETVDDVLSAPLTKNTDVFSTMLNQQGITIGNQARTEVKPELAQPAPDTYHIASQIVDQARLVSGLKNTEMIIKLTPEHLGELTFKVSVENGIVSASFHSDNPEVRTVIESSLYQLKQEMSNQGLKIDNVGVYAGLGQFFSNGQQSGSNQQTEVKVQNEKKEEEFLDFFEATDSIKQAADGTGVDYRA